MRDLVAPILGPLTAEAFAGSVRGAVAHMARMRARLTDMIRRDDRTLLAPDADWPTVLRSALAGAVAGLRGALGPQPAAGRWRRGHATPPPPPPSAPLPRLAAPPGPP